MINREQNSPWNARLVLPIISGFPFAFMAILDWLHWKFHGDYNFRGLPKQ